MTAADIIPIDLSHLAGAALAFVVATAIVALRYFLVAVPTYWLFWQDGAEHERALHDQQLPAGQIRREIGWSLIAAVIFGAAAVVIGYVWQQGYSLIYTEISGFMGSGGLGYLYLPVSFGIYAFAHELYYYGTHRWMHHPKIYPIVHAVHHESRKTSPFASFSFHPYEALIQAAFIPLMIMIVPIHPVVLLTYLTFMTVTAVSNHLGVELISSDAIKKHFISGEHHDFHHKCMNVHFGLYFTATDRWWGTTLAARRRRKIATLPVQQGDIAR